MERKIHFQVFESLSGSNTVNVGSTASNLGGDFNRPGTLNLAGNISGTGSVAQNGSGTTVLIGNNTYTGGTIVNAGTLTVNSAQALGTGNVQINGGILRADPQPINVKGNYTQNAGGTLQLQVAGAGSGQYDTLNVGGTATLGGTLQLLSLGFQPKAGNQLTLVTAAGAVLGRFAAFLNPFPAGPAFNTVDLVYGRNSVVVEFLNLQTPVASPIPSPAPPPVIASVNFASFALTPNQLAAGNLVDEIELKTKAADLVSFLVKEPIANLPADLEEISPDSSVVSLTKSLARLPKTASAALLPGD
jgi:autotransporter-associated beta strand protein